MIDITLPDGSVKNVEVGTTALDIANGISEGLARNVLAAEVAGEVVDPQRPITQSSTLKLLTWNDEEGKSTMWHSSAHLMAEALESMFDGIKFWVGPPVEFGFYYDVDFGEHKFTDAHIPELEKKMLELAKQKAFEEGHKQAWVEATQKFEKEIKENTAFYQRVIRRMGLFWLEQKEELMQALMTTGFEVAKQIIDHVQLSEEFIEQQHQKILELLHKVEAHSKPVLQVSQEDESRILELVKGSSLPIQVSIVAGQGFNKGEFILDTEHERWIGVQRLIAEHFQTHVQRV